MEDVRSYDELLVSVQRSVSKKCVGQTQDGSVSQTGTQLDSAGAECNEQTFPVNLMLRPITNECCVRCFAADEFALISCQGQLLFVLSEAG